MKWWTGRHLSRRTGLAIQFVAFPAVYALAPWAVSLIAAAVDHKAGAFGLSVDLAGREGLDIQNFKAGTEQDFADVSLLFRRSRVSTRPIGYSRWAPDDPQVPPNN